MWEAAGGSEALEILDHLESCVVLLDLVMPGTSGEDVLTELRQSGRLENIRVIVMSGLTHGIDTPGAHLVLTKPISLHQIVSHLEHLCPPS